MPKRICRITWRKGEPLGLAVYPSTTFLDLPREIRDRIYYQALVVSEPITVSSVTVGDPSTQHDEETKQKIVSQAYTIEGRDPILDQIALGLLRCQSTVSSEAAVTFYQLNTFHFDGNEVWNPLYTFLKRIGDSNRGFLRNLSANAESLNQVYQDRYGARISTHPGWLSAFDIVHSFAHRPPPRIKYTRPVPSRDDTRPIRYDESVQPIPHNEYLYRPLQYLDPAIQACFRLLDSDGSPLTLKLILKDSGVPGVNVVLGLPIPSMALPNFIESLRQEFAGRVMVLWNCVGHRDVVIQQTDSIREKGWEIVETKERQTHSNCFPTLPPTPIIHLTLRRREVDRIPPTFCESCCMQWPSTSS